MTAPEIHGAVHDPAFAGVRDAFVRNFAEHGEVGGAVAVSHRGRRVVDLWGGEARPGAPWGPDTITLVFSCTKLAATTCLHLLVDRGMVTLDDRVADHWPEFGQASKQDVTLRMLLNHTSGVCGLTDPAPEGIWALPDEAAGLLAAQPPVFEPGTQVAYGAVAFGWLVGEVVRRVTDQSLGTFWRSEVADPHNLDFWIGLPQEFDDRVAHPVIPDFPEQLALVTVAAGDPDSLSHAAFVNTGGLNAFSVAARRAELGGGGGHATAHGLLGLAEALANAGDHARILSVGRVVDLARESSATDRDLVMLEPTRYGAGALLSLDNRDQPGGGSFVVGPSAFGHSALGGQAVVVDPEHRLAIAYTSNLVTHQTHLDARGQSLIDAAYASVLDITNPNDAPDSPTT